MDGEGAVWLTLRHRRSDGTTHLKFKPLELLERLAVLTPRPHINLVLYYGVLAPRGRVERIMRHLGLPTDRPEPSPARAPHNRTDACVRAWDETCQHSTRRFDGADTPGVCRRRGPISALGPITPLTSAPKARRDLVPANARCR